MNYKNNISYRKETLQKLLQNILHYEKEVIDALYKDFKKPEFEAILTETNYVISDLKKTIKNIENWARPKSVLPSILNFPSRDYIYREPYGKVLVISPWNYPFQLAFCPLIAAVAAGNSVTIKPSEMASHSAAIISKIIRETFETKHVVAILGDAKVAENLLLQRWDYIFFTGSVTIGKLVAKAAAIFLTPVTLELGGKNPCIVDESADLQLAAKRIVWGKFINAGQTCIAADYIVVKKSVKTEFQKLLVSEIEKAYGIDASKSADYPRIINPQHWKRLYACLENQDVIYGGQTNENDNYISPTLLDSPQLDSAVMKDEIFGPILPIFGYESQEDLDKIILHYEKPLGLYVFSTNKKFTDSIISNYSFGGGCINDTVVQFNNSRLPFGGVGHSGIGAYHGSRSFDVFSHQKSIVHKGNWLDIPLRYAPYGNKIKWIKKVLKWI